MKSFLFTLVAFALLVFSPLGNAVEEGDYKFTSTYRTWSWPGGYGPFVDLCGRMTIYDIHQLDEPTQLFDYIYVTTNAVGRSEYLLGTGAHILDTDEVRFKVFDPDLDDPAVPHIEAKGTIDRAYWNGDIHSPNPSQTYIIGTFWNVPDDSVSCP